MTTPEAMFGSKLPPEDFLALLGAFADSEFGTPDGAEERITGREERVLVETQMSLTGPEGSGLQGEQQARLAELASASMSTAPEDHALQALGRQASIDPFIARLVAEAESTDSEE